ncbi:MAG: ANTAR domain-containing protein [Propionicimonas sp.]
MSSKVEYDEPGAGAGGSSTRTLPQGYAWLQSVFSCVQDGVLVFDDAGLVVTMNSAFTDLLGFSMGEAPILPPYPWWPTETEDPVQRAAIDEGHAEARAAAEGTAEFCFYNHERQPVWVACADAVIGDSQGGVAAVVRTFHDITRQKKAQTRRAAAARLSADLARTEDLAALLSLAEHGFEALFGGGSSTQLHLSEPYLFSGYRRITSEELAEGSRTGLAGTASPDAMNPRPGILLLPQTSTIDCRVWVQFRRPRRIDPDEMIVADLLAQAFGLAVERLFTAQQVAEQQTSLQLAIESHRQIGQAVGILVERHRLLPSQAFDRIKQASQKRNLKLREIASRVIETGADPEDA